MRCSEHLGLLDGNSHLIGGQDVACDADTVDPENELHNSEADDTDDQIGGLLGEGFHSLFGSFFIVGIGAIFDGLGLVAKLSLSLGSQDLNDDKWNEVDETGDEELHVETSLVEAGGQEGTDWSEEDVEDDDERGHIWGHLGGEHDAGVSALEGVITAIVLGEGGLLNLFLDKRVTDGSLDQLLVFLLGLVHL